MNRIYYIMMNKSQERFFFFFFFFSSFCFFFFFPPQGLKVSKVKHQNQATKQKLQSSHIPQELHIVCPGFAFILSLLCAPMCLFLALGKVIRQHDAISAVFLLLKFRFSNFRTFQTQIVLIFLILEEISLPFFVFWKLTEKSLFFYKS